MGEYRHSLDAKNRLIIPSRFREELGDAFVITRYLVGCLTVYTTEQWEKITGKLAAIPMTSKAGRQFSRIFLSKAVNCEPDSQGRILIPQQLRESAELLRETVLIGVGERIEFWNPEILRRYENSMEAELDDALRHLSEIGI